MMPAAMDATLLIPARDECEALRTLLPEIREVMDPLGITYEVIVVDDGSRDETWELLRSLSSGWPNLTGIRLRKSAGQTAALQAGFDYACGEVIITLDGDGQNDPKDIPVLLEKLVEGYDLVSGWRRDRKDKGFSRVLPSMIANRFIRFWTGSRLRDQGCGLKAYRRPILQGLSMLGDQHRYIAALLEGLGASVAETPVNHRARSTGRSHYGWGRVPRVLLDLLFLKFILSYSLRPLHLFGGGGFLALCAGFLACLEVSYAKLVHQVPAADRPLLLLGVLLLLVGMVLITLGILAELLVRNYYQMGGMRSYWVRERLAADDQADRP